MSDSHTPAVSSIDFSDLRPAIGDAIAGSLAKIAQIQNDEGPPAAELFERIKRQTHTLGRIEAFRERKGKEERSVRHYIISAEISPERLLELTRNHWKIENCLHWVLDVVMDEDRMQNRTLSGPEYLAAIRRIALNIIRLMDDDHSLKGRMETVAMSDEYLLGLLVNALGNFKSEGSNPRQGGRRHESEATLHYLRNE